MFLIRSNDRGHANHGWLDTRHTFSFADYHDPTRMGFSVLRVINEDLIAAGSGFPTHSHQDMEIISYMAEGLLEHKDSMGNTSIIRPGEVQRMSAGTGVKHSEYNPSKDQPSHLIQIWILPNKKGHRPGYEQKSFLNKFMDSDFVLAASQEGIDGSVTLNQDVDLYVGRSPEKGARVFKTRKDRCVWVQVVRGQLNVNDEILEAGDGVGLEKPPAELMMKWSKGVEFLLFDLPVVRR